MSAEGFFERLCGVYSDGLPLAEVPATSRRRKSIVDHLQFLLNTRQGMLSHLPGYGMPDVGDLYRRLPGSASELQRGLEHAIRGFEPRLEHVRVTCLDFEPGSGHIRFRISSTISGGERLVMETRFFPDGCSAVQANG
jgi:type VI secretion system protein